jgi:hypothetical protein
MDILKDRQVRAQAELLGNQPNTQFLRFADIVHVDRVSTHLEMTVVGRYRAA